MNKSEYLEKHHAICEQAIGSIYMSLNNELPAQAKREVKLCINELDLLSEFYAKNNVAFMIKTVLDSGEWKKDGGLYHNWKLGIRNLNEAFKIVTRDK